MGLIYTKGIFYGHNKYSKFCNPIVIVKDSFTRNEYSYSTDSQITDDYYYNGISNPPDKFYHNGIVIPFDHKDNIQLYQFYGEYSYGSWTVEVDGEKYQKEGFITPWGKFAVNTSTGTTYGWAFEFIDIISNDGESYNIEFRIIACGIRTDGTLIHPAIDGYGGSARVLNEYYGNKNEVIDTVGLIKRYCKKYTVTQYAETKTII